MVTISTGHKVRKYGWRDDEDFETPEADALAVISGPGMGITNNVNFCTTNRRGMCAGRFFAKGV